MVHRPIGFHLQNATRKIKLSRISRKWLQSIKPQAWGLSECGSLCDCTRHTPMSSALHPRPFRSSEHQSPGILEGSINQGLPYYTEALGLCFVRNVPFTLPWMTKVAEIYLPETFQLSFPIFFWMRNQSLEQGMTCIRPLVRLVAQQDTELST